MVLLQSDDFQRLRSRSPVQGMVPQMLVHVLAQYLSDHGVPPCEVIGEAAALGRDGPWGRFPAERYCEFLLHSALRLRDPLLGLSLGQSIRPTHLGALGYVLQSCENLGAVLMRIQRYHRLLHDINPIEHEVTSRGLDIVWGVAHGRPGALFDESGVTAFVAFARRLTGEPLRPLNVDFVNPPPADTRPFVAYFGCPVHWSQPLTRLALPLPLLSLPVAGADPLLRQLLEEQVDRVLATLPQAGNLVEMTRRVVGNLACEGIPELEQVAAALQLAPRVFYRRLAEQGHNFRDLREATLQRLAETYLADGLSASEVAGRLGYTEPSAFSRAFKRWKGCTPQAWRQGNRPAPGESQTAPGQRDG